jgi:hypothetical protein
MNKTIARIMLIPIDGMIKFLDKPRHCQFWKSCPYRSVDAYECNHSGSHYCGKFREYSLRGVPKCLVVA